MQNASQGKGLAQSQLRYTVHGSRLQVGQNEIILLSNPCFQQTKNVGEEGRRLLKPDTFHYSVTG